MTTNVRLLKTPAEIREAALRASEREHLLGQEIARRTARLEDMASDDGGEDPSETGEISP